MKVGSKSHPKRVCMVRQPLFDPAREGSKHHAEGKRRLPAPGTNSVGLFTPSVGCVPVLL